MFRNCFPLAAVAAFGCLSTPVLAERELAIYENGVPGAYGSRSIDISADGRYVATSGFRIEASPTGEAVVVTDRLMGTSDYLRSPLTGALVDQVANVDISKNGRYIVLQFENEPFVAGSKEFGYVYDRAEDNWLSLTRSFDNSPLQGCTEQFETHGRTYSDVSDNGIVVFESTCSNLVASDTNGVVDVFSFDVHSGEIALVSRDTENAQLSLDGASYGPRISADGRYVVYSTQADPHVVPCTTGGTEHVALYDRLQNTTTALNSCESPRSRRIFHQPAISADGSTVVLNAGDDVLTSYDILSATFSHTILTGMPGRPEGDRRTDLSGDGRYLIFRSSESYDINGIFVEPFESFANDPMLNRFDRLTGKLESLTTHYVTGRPLHDSLHNEMAISGNGETVVVGINNTTPFYLEHDGNDENGIVISREDGFARQYQSVHARNSEDNFSEFNGMVLVADNLWATELDFDGVGDQFKFDMGGSWDDGIDFGDNDSDGVAELNGSNINVNDGAGRYRVMFNDQTHRYSVTKLGEEVYDTVFVRGTFNTWQTLSMVSRGKNIWDAVVDFSESNNRFKFDIHGDWSENYGDTALDFVGELSGNDIVVSTPGKYLVRFYADTKQYALEPLVFAADPAERAEQLPRVFLPDLHVKTLTNTRLRVDPNSIWVRDHDIKEFRWISDALTETITVDQQNRPRFNNLFGASTVFQTPGEFDLTFVVVDMDDNEASTTVRVFVEESFVPIANAGPDVTVLAGTQLNFDSSLSSDVDGVIISRNWTVNGSFAPASFLFSETGIFDVQLTVKDDDGLEGSDNMAVTVVNSLPGSNVTASCLNANTVFGQDVYVVGSTPELGSWSPLNGVLLNTTDGVDWSGDLGLLPAGQNVQWKCVKVFNGSVEWQAGDDNSFSTNIDNMSISGSF